MGWSCWVWKAQGLACWNARGKRLNDLGGWMIGIWEVEKLCEIFTIHDDTSIHSAFTMIIPCMRGIFDHIGLESLTESWTWSWKFGYTDSLACPNQLSHSNFLCTSDSSFSHLTILGKSITKHPTLWEIVPRNAAVVEYFPSMQQCLGVAMREDFCDVWRSWELRCSCDEFTDNFGQKATG